MTNTIYNRTINKLVIGMSLLELGEVGAATTIVSSSVYLIDEGVDFSVSNNGTSDFLFSWTDSSGTFTDIPDPTFQLGIGETYTFRRVTSSHPLLITDTSLPVVGSDGAFFRTTTDSAVINAAILSPTPDFTADPAPTSDLITWTPTSDEQGNYFYTCQIAGHAAQVGAISVVSLAVPEPSGMLLVALGAIGGMTIRRRNRS